MIHVQNANFSECANILYSDNPNHSGIIAGECKGDVWVDNVKNPAIALVYSNAIGGFSILGEPKNDSVYNEFSNYLREKLFKELKSKGIDDFEFSVESKITEEHILRLFFDKSINQEDEYFYKKSCANETGKVDKYSIVRVDPNFIGQLQAGKYDNAEFLTKRLLESWETYEQFFMKSLAFVAILEKSIVAVIIGTARYQNVIPIDIETKEEHRKKGLAYLLTQYFVNGCVENGLVAQWNCTDSNIASRSTVLKAGFEFLKKKPYYWFKI